MAEVQGITLAVILSRHGLQENDLHKECSLSDILQIAIKIRDWKVMGNYLSIPEEKLEAIRVNNGTEEQRRIASLQAWKEREGSSATYLKLAAALNKRERNDLVEEICRVVNTLACTSTVAQNTLSASNEKGMIQNQLLL